MLRNIDEITEKAEDEEVKTMLGLIAMEEEAPSNSPRTQSDSRTYR